MLKTHCPVEKQVSGGSREFGYIGPGLLHIPALNTICSFLKFYVLSEFCRVKTYLC